MDLFSTWTPYEDVRMLCLLVHLDGYMVFNNVTTVDLLKY